MSVITIHSNVRDYSVHFQDSARFIQEFSRFPERLFVIDENVWRHYGGGCLSCIPEGERMVFSVSEERKGLDSVMEIYDRLMDRAAKKNMTLISLGGGIVQDVTGFVASTLYRGLNWVFVPTTLLAQADSCIGSKTSLNYKRFKNLIGTFYPPAEVHIHSPFLQTLEEADFLSGLGEVVKLHLMGGEKTAAALAGSLPAVLERNPDALLQATRTSLSIKLSYMEGDEFDTGRRNLLNFGHCFGHALETVSSYAIPHGQAVVIGMLFANIAAVQRGLLAPSLASHLADVLLRKSLSIPLRKEYFGSDAILAAMKQDKKRTGDGLVVVMMRSDYTFEKLTDYSPDELVATTAELMESLRVS
ncbi:AroB-related putative sugar phosphate phospholyase (cyclizing) [Geobacter sp. AOG1]|uniref:AroB-related putative sugar phosphate phospholyase (cyclizing) n=1 Tax=Geobacter sp. AOG1 TaxID=1566346 RepID=UPI001CC6F7D6|nr:AroB-related putative sugar phosphate phospholyase (cyclizing) [Geobacter sp. AOG1]GFE58142.1 3-dehydroquinate synthase [Geobacter sp. AOG1]